LLRRDYPPRIYLVVTVIWLLNSTWQHFSFELTADVAAVCLLLWSLFFWRRPESQMPGYPLAGLFAGLSAITQPLALLVPLPVVATILYFRPRDLKSRTFWLGAGFFLLPSAAWSGAKWLLFGTPGDVLNQNWSLLGFHLDYLDFYLFGFVSSVGIPTCVFIALGLAVMLGQARHDPSSFLQLSLASSHPGIPVFLGSIADSLEHTRVSDSGFPPFSGRVQELGLESRSRETPILKLSHTNRRP